MHLNFPLRLTLNTLLTLLVLKGYFFATARSQMNILYLISFVQDAFLLILNYFIFVFSTKKFVKIFHLSRVLFFIFYLIFGITSFVYTFFLPDLFSFPINLFGISSENISFFLEYFINLKIVLLLAFGIGIIFLISFYFPQQIRFQRILSFAGLILSLLFIPTVLRGAINPIVYSLQEQVMLSFSANNFIEKLSSPVADGSKAEQFQFLDKAFDSIPVVEIRYNRVVVLVMEGINYDDFINESKADSNSFINRHRKNIYLFNNYYSLNLDSYTSLIAVLNSIFIPYQAYVKENRYLFVNKYNNLTRFFDANGFNTFFVTSYGRQQERFIPNISEWTQTKYMDNIEGNTKYACVTTNKIEYACEDFSVLEDIVNLLKINQRSFAFQEMVYGHTSEWKEKTGKGAIEYIEYYNSYFKRIAEKLKENNILDNTLLIITSDHGPRDNPYNIKNYHIPLIVFASDLQQRSNNEFLSHLDFKDVILELIADRQFTPRQKPIYTIGNSGEFVYGMIAPDGKHIFINNRLRHIQSNASEAEIRAFSRNFQDYQNYFEYLRLHTN